MSEREDVEALANLIPLGFDRERDGVANVHEAAERILASDWLAAHVEAVRVSERVRLAGEVEALARERDDAQHHLAYHLADFRPGVSAEATGDLAVDMAHFAERMRRERDEARAALVPVPGVRLTEEE